MDNATKCNYLLAPCWRSFHSCLTHTEQSLFVSQHSLYISSNWRCFYVVVPSLPEGGVHARLSYEHCWHANLLWTPNYVVLFYFRLYLVNNPWTGHIWSVYVVKYIYFNDMNVNTGLHSNIWYYEIVAVISYQIIFCRYLNWTRRLLHQLTLSYITIKHNP